MNTNLSTLSDDLSNQIFFDHLDQKSRFECTQLNKKIHTQIWSKLLKDFEIAPNENATPYSEVLKYYRKYNHYFQKKLPSTFVLINPKTITDVKNQIDAKLSLPGTMPIIPLLDEVWNAFIYELEPYQQYFLSDVTPKHRMTIISNPLSNLNEEISFLMTSGIRPRSISPLIKQQWCSLETVQLLLNKKVPICPDDVLTAIRCDRYQEILTIFFKSMIGHDYYFACYLKVFLLTIRL